MSRNNARHGLLRRIIGVAFSNNAMNQFRETLQKYSMTLIDAIEKVADDNDEIVDMNDWFNRFSFDVFASVVHANAWLDRRSYLVWTKFRRIERGRAASLDQKG
jgi:cytochrome P450